MQHSYSFYKGLKNNLKTAKRFIQTLKMWVKVGIRPPYSTKGDFKSRQGDILLIYYIYIFLLLYVL